jgi:hypothetical protein
MMTLDEARGVVVALAAYFPRASFPEATRLAWAAALGEHDAVDALAAVNDLGRSSKYLPSLAELLEATRTARRDRYARLPERTLPAPGGTAVEVARAKSRLVRAGASPADDPPWADDTPAEGITFGEYLRDHATRDERRTVGRIFPTLAARYGITAELLDEQRPPLFDRDGEVPP